MELTAWIEYNMSIEEHAWSAYANKLKDNFMFLACRLPITHSIQIGPNIDFLKTLKTKIL